MLYEVRLADDNTNTATCKNCQTFLNFRQIVNSDKIKPYLKKKKEREVIKACLI